MTVDLCVHDSRSYRTGFVPLSVSTLKIWINTRTFPGKMMEFCPSGKLGTLNNPTESSVIETVIKSTIVHQEM